ncbi:hypothetical protein [Frankia tisae]|uniref:hypothetical protein n=1 Tax=Frankia tisae TaxID=2950104 RepID=UPI0021C10D81|nr:hypothetical protein [Frankia tisae]
MIVLTAATALLGLATLAAVTVITLGSHELAGAAVVAGLPPAVMSPFAVALPAVIRVAEAEQPPRRRSAGGRRPGGPRSAERRGGNNGQ